VQKFLAKAEREQNVESDFSQRETSISSALRGQADLGTFPGTNLAALELDYDDLSRNLGTPPRDNILVTLYTEQLSLTLRGLLPGQEAINAASSAFQSAASIP